MAVYKASIISLFSKKSQDKPTALSELFLLDSELDWESYFDVFVA